MRWFFYVLICCVWALPSFAYDEQSFQTFLDDVKKQAVSQGVSSKTTDEVLATAQFLPKAIELDQKQPEKKISFAQYKQNILTEKRVALGRKMMRKHKERLRVVSQKYGVQPQYIVALWGIETNYGGYKGNWGVVSSLATLAYEGRRRDFFTKELLNALRIIDEGHISLKQFRGSWAGALGHNQFMPSSFLSLAVDGNNDGRKDIWNDLEDVFASSANYLAQNGWRSDQRWGREVSVPAKLPKNLIGRTKKHDLSFWQYQGVRQANGSDLPKVEISAALVRPDSDSPESYMIYGN